MIYSLSVLTLAVLLSSEAYTGCSDGWTPNRGQCYRWLRWLATDYQRAVQLCRTSNSDLLTINSKEEADFVTLYFSHVDDDVWLDAEHSDYSNWIEDGEVDGGGRCKAVHFLNDADARWVHGDCAFSNEVVCKTPQRNASDSICRLVREIDANYCPPTTPTLATPTEALLADPEVTCEEGWAEFGERCFRHFANKTTQHEAWFRCRQLNSSLASVRSKAENRFLHSLNPTAHWTWVGGKIFNLDPVQIVWLDGWMGDYNNFDDNKAVKSDLTLDAVCLDLNRNPPHWANTYSIDMASYVCAKDIRFK